jgi:hypothetical protein
MTERTMTKADLVTSVLLIVFSAAVVANSIGMPTMADRGESPYSGPGLVPGFIGIMVFLLSVAMLVRSMRKAPRSSFPRIGVRSRRAIVPRGRA